MFVRYLQVRWYFEITNIFVVGIQFGMHEMIYIPRKHFPGKGETIDKNSLEANTFLQGYAKSYFGIFPVATLPDQRNGSLS